MSPINEKNCIEEILDDKKLRVALARESHQFFFNIYFPHYVKCQAADFHKNFFEISENQDPRIEIIMSFRGSAKSAIFSTSYPIWAITGKLKKKFVVLIGKTQTQARAMLENIKKEMESNKRLVADLGPFQESVNNFSNYSLYFPWYDAKIIGVSMEQSIRGLRYKSNRPDLIIADDIENLASVSTQENRDKTYEWVNSEILNLGQENTKYIFIGNLLHDDSLMMRLIQDVNKGNFDARILKIPLIDDANNITWTGLYPDMTAIDRKRKKVPDSIAWDREYLLKITSPTNQIVNPKAIHYYDYDPFSVKTLPAYRYSFIAIDPAISKSINAAKTAMLIFHVFNNGKDLKIMIDQKIVNQRMDFTETTDKAICAINTLGNRTSSAHVLIESVAYQQALIDDLRKRKRICVEEFIPHGAKDERLRSVAHLIEEGVVFFPKHTSSDLVNQICYFYSEKYKDLADTLSMGLHHILKKQRNGEMGVLSLMTSPPQNYYSTEPYEKKLKRFELLEKLNGQGFFLL